MEEIVLWLCILNKLLMYLYPFLLVCISISGIDVCVYHLCGLHRVYVCNCIMSRPTSVSASLLLPWPLALHLPPSLSNCGHLCLCMHFQFHQQLQMRKLRAQSCYRAHPRASLVSCGSRQLALKPVCWPQAVSPCLEL